MSWCVNCSSSFEPTRHLYARLERRSKCQNGPQEGTCFGNQPTLSRRCSRWLSGSLLHYLDQGGATHQPNEKRADETGSMMATTDTRVGRRNRKRTGKSTDASWASWPPEYAALFLAPFPHIPPSTR